MNKLALITLLFSIALVNCKPKTKIVPAPEPAPPISSTENPLFTCKALGPAPAPFGWRDSLTNLERTVNGFQFNPLNTDELIITVNGVVAGSNRLYCFNIRTGKKVFLGEADSFTPDVNKYGWVIFSTSDSNIFKIKCSGDSLTQLTFGNTTRDPKWDYTGNNFYFYQSAYLLVQAQLMYANSKGVLLTNLPAFITNAAPFKTKNKVIYQRLKDNLVTLTLRDMDAKTESALISAPYEQGQIYFDDLCLDNKDENLYWSNLNGVYKCSISTLKIDTVFKNCFSVNYLNPVFQKSHPDEILVGCHFVTPVLPDNLLHRYLSVQANLVTNEKKILDVFGVLVD